MRAEGTEDTQGPGAELSSGDPLGHRKRSGLGPVTHLVDVPEPLADVLEALGVGDVVHQHDAHGPSVVGGGDGVEPLLPRRVPVGNTTALSQTGSKGGSTRHLCVLLASLPRDARASPGAWNCPITTTPMMAHRVPFHASSHRDNHPTLSATQT